MNKNRLVAFTDAIIAIAATIMVLDLHLPHPSNLRGLWADRTVFFAYTISYILIYTVWSSHHDLFEKAQFISIRTFLLNGLWLFFLTLVPFATNWVGTDPDTTWAEVFYCLILLLWSIAFHLMDHQIVRDNPTVPHDNSTRPLDRSIIYLTYLSGIGIGIAFFSPVLSLIIVGFLSVLMTLRMFSTGYHHSEDSH
ncbi:TMEM175 family protein [Levilactobacillus bambusae]|uniref:DUF1211 domain-containing protein n=1 Tax=Levilactobacillus bambusae TaxID=2024736 RepID=A0A2V1MYT6_9LACO|nr:TMEM175 family protein [Levilactobacillus bambusae]PWF99647.1 hypothetical protein DCM90_07470 [Levilactobacillus bambusae]